MRRSAFRTCLTTFPAHLMSRATCRRCTAFISMALCGQSRSTSEHFPIKSCSLGSPVALHARYVRHHERAQQGDRETSSICTPVGGSGRWPPRST